HFFTPQCCFRWIISISKDTPRPCSLIHTRAQHTISNELSPVVMYELQGHANCGSINDMGFP
ncbi:hypothetical protein PAXRUDRAFT_141282, partial [Paxillus rubicundulus Ve08.2h10]